MDNEYITYEEQLSDKRWKQKRLLILKRDNFTCKMCGNKGDTEERCFNVHHRYYKYNVLAWEYDNNSLVTLCSNCHTLIHKVTTPCIYYNKGDRLIPMNFTPCSRCRGAGHFREYKHVEGGICFRCRGKRYEELLNTDSVDVESYQLSDDECFDVLHPIENKEVLNNLFHLGISYDKGINGVSVNYDEAYKYYRWAALNGHAKAQNNLGCLLQKRNQMISALRWFAYAALQGNTMSKKNIGMYYQKTDLLLSQIWLSI